jgi:hypothetical protein
MKALLLIFMIFFSLIPVYCQTEKINQFDNQNKKNGKWIVYLDQKWNKVDSSKAIYYRYTWYDHGINIHPMGAGGGKNSTMQTTVDTSKQTGKAKMLDGEYKWYENGKLKYTHIFKNGEYISYTEYNNSGKISTFFDYAKGCEAQPHSWTIFVYDKDGNVTLTSPMCKDKNGNWPKMRD